MTGTWLAGLIRKRSGRVVAAALGVAIAVSLLARLGSFLVGPRATMTARAAETVAVDWQVGVQPNAAGGGTAAVMRELRNDPATEAALPVAFADTPGLTATTQGTTQTTGAGKVVGLPPGYLTQFPDAVRRLTGTTDGPMVAQQTAANLHVAPGDKVTVQRAGMGAYTVTISGVV